MTQVHKRFTVEQVKVLFQGYLQGNLSRAEVESMLEIGKTRFFALLKAYRQDPQAFCIASRARYPKPVIRPDRDGNQARTTPG